MGYVVFRSTNMPLLHDVAAAYNVYSEWEAIIVDDKVVLPGWREPRAEQRAEAFLKGFLAAYGFYSGDIKEEFTDEDNAN